MSLLIISTSASAGQFLMVGNWQLPTDNEASEPRGKLSATATTIAIQLDAHPGETYRVPYKQDETGRFSVQLIGDPIVATQGRVSKPDLFGIAIEIRY